MKDKNISNNRGNVKSGKGDKLDFSTVRREDLLGIEGLDEPVVDRIMRRQQQGQLNSLDDLREIEGLGHNDKMIDTIRDRVVNRRSGVQGGKSGGSVGGMRDKSK